MIIDHFDPAWTIPPGMLFAEHAAELRLSQKVLAERLGVQRDWLCDFVDGLVALSPQQAQKVAQLTCTDPQMWMHLEKRYRQDLADGKSVLGH